MSFNPLKEITELNEAFVYLKNQFDRWVKIVNGLVTGQKQLEHKCKNLEEKVEFLESKLNRLEAMTKSEEAPTAAPKEEDVKASNSCNAGFGKESGFSFGGTQESTEEAPRIPAMREPLLVVNYSPRPIHFNWIQNYTPKDISEVLESKYHISITEEKCKLMSDKIGARRTVKAPYRYDGHFVDTLTGKSMSLIEEIVRICRTANAPQGYKASTSECITREVQINGEIVRFERADLK